MRYADAVPIDIVLTHGQWRGEIDQTHIRPVDVEDRKRRVVAAVDPITAMQRDSGGEPIQKIDRPAVRNRQHARHDAASRTQSATRAKFCARLSPFGMA